MFATRVSNHGARLNTQPKALHTATEWLLTDEANPTPKSQNGKHNSLWFDRNQMLGGPRVLVFAKWNRLFAWGFGGVNVTAVHIAGTICCLVATWVHERLGKANAACTVDHLPVKMPNAKQSSRLDQCNYKTGEVGAWSMRSLVD